MDRMTWVETEVVEGNEICWASVGTINSYDDSVDLNTLQDHWD